MSSNEVKSNGAIGCLRATMSMIIALMFTVAIGIAAYKSFGGWQMIVGIIISLCSLIVSIPIANSNKPISVFDCTLPFVISIIAAIVFWPVSLFAGSVFSFATCIGAGIFLSMGLFLYRGGKISGAFLIIPALTFVYEVLPIELPTDIDNFLALGVNTLNCVMGGFFRKTRGEIDGNDDSGSGDIA